MNKTNFKLFTMFLAGIAFSAMTVLAATISISTNFEDGVTQYLKKLVILKNDNTTWMVLDWNTLSGENIYGTNITWTNIKGTNITWNKIYGQSGLFQDGYFSGIKLQQNSNRLELDGNNIRFNNSIKFYTWNSQTEFIIINPLWIQILWNIASINNGIYGKNGYFSDTLTWGIGNFNHILLWTGNTKWQMFIDNNQVFFSINANKLTYYFNNNDLMSIAPNGVSITWTLNTNGSITAKTGYFSEIAVQTGRFGDALMLETKRQGGRITYTNDLRFSSGLTDVTLRIDTLGNLESRKNIRAHGDITATGNISVTGSISAKWNISATGNITSSKTGSFKNIDVDGDITAKNLNIFNINNLISTNNSNITIGYTNVPQVGEVTKSTTTIKGNVKQLSTISQRVFTWLNQDEGASTYYPVFFPKWTLSWTQNEPLDTDSKRYIHCRKHNSIQHFYIHWSTWLATIYKPSSNQPRQYNNISYVLKFGEDGYFELKAWETFAVFPNQCWSWEFVVSKQEYWWYITPRSSWNNGGFEQRSWLVLEEFNHGAQTLP